MEMTRYEAEQALDLTTPYTKQTLRQAVRQGIKTYHPDKVRKTAMDPDVAAKRYADIQRAEKLLTPLFDGQPAEYAITPAERGDESDFNATEGAQATNTQNDAQNASEGGQNAPEGDDTPHQKARKRKKRRQRGTTTNRNGQPQGQTPRQRAAQATGRGQQQIPKQAQVAAQSFAPSSFSPTYMEDITAFLYKAGPSVGVIRWILLIVIALLIWSQARSVAQVGIESIRPLDVAPIAILAVIAILEGFTKAISTLIAWLSVKWAKSLDAGKLIPTLLTKTIYWTVTLSWRAVGAIVDMITSSI